MKVFVTVRSLLPHPTPAALTARLTRRRRKLEGVPQRRVTTCMKTKQKHNKDLEKLTLGGYTGKRKADLLVIT